MRLRPQIGLAEAISYLQMQVQELRLDLQNAHNDGARRRYLDWIDKAGRELRDRFADPNLVDGLHSRQYWSIRDQPSPLDTPTRDLVEHELRRHLERLQEALDHLRLFEPMTGIYGAPLVLDTSVFVDFDPLADRIDRERWGKITGVTRMDLRLVVPVLVLDELDSLAHTGDRKKNAKARAALNVLDPFVDALRDQRPVEVRPDTSWMTVEILPDAPGNRRQADPDMELIDRAQFLSQVVDHSVVFVTDDRGMRVRGTVRQLLPAGSKVRMVAMPSDLRIPD
jgi:hypothetical protein